MDSSDWVDHLHAAQARRAASAHPAAGVEPEHPPVPAVRDEGARVRGRGGGIRERAGARALTRRPALRDGRRDGDARLSFGELRVALSAGASAWMAQLDQVYVRLSLLLLRLILIILRHNTRTPSSLPPLSLSLSLPPRHPAQRKAAADGASRSPSGAGRGTRALQRDAGDADAGDASEKTLLDTLQGVEQMLGDAASARRLAARGRRDAAAARGRRRGRGVVGRGDRGRVRRRVAQVRAPFESADIDSSASPDVPS